MVRRTVNPEAPFPLEAVLTNSRCEHGRVGLLCGASLVERDAGRGRSIGLFTGVRGR